MTVVALGMFDGVHIGHRELVCRAVELAAQRGARALIYTYENHPRAAFGASPKLLMSAQERMEALSRLGAQVVADPFNANYAMQSPEQFAAVLKERFNASVAVAGFNYGFGHHRSGNIHTLRMLGTQLGFETVEIAPVHYLGTPVSSSRIRAVLERGDVGYATAMLGRPYRMSGEILENRRIGRTIGFPTANIACTAERVLPLGGVYATRALLGGRCYPAVTNIGTNPTVGGRATSIETHIIGYTGDAYGQTMAVEFIRYIRGEQKFDGLDALKAQIARDVETALGVLGGG